MSAATFTIDSPETAEQLRRRLVELQAEGDRIRAERDFYRAEAYRLYAQLHPADLSEEWLAAPEGQSVVDELAEFDRKRGQ